MTSGIWKIRPNKKGITTRKLIGGVKGAAIFGMRAHRFIKNDL